MPISRFEIYSRRGQEVVMVLYALRELGAIHSKEEVLRFIRERHFYQLHPEDKQSYESKREWKADTLLCYGRKDAVTGEWMFHHDEKDSWELTREGHEALESIIACFRAHQWEIHKCFLWRPEFKKVVDPTHIPSSHDHKAPKGRRRKTHLELALELLAKLSEEHRLRSSA